MNQLRVWAPNAISVEAQVEAERLPLRASTDGSGGWWHLEGVLAPGTDYQFIVDGAGPFPDPRSQSQPQGVDGPSRILDHEAFRWSDGQWLAPPLSGGLIYELHIGTFTPEGTFDSAIARLDYLKELGVTHVEIMPVAEFSGDHGWGYDGVDLYAPHHAYGGPQGLKRLVDACHARGLAVLLDVVYNHFGPAGNYLPRFGPYLTHKYHTPWGDALNLDDRGSDEVRRLLCDNALAWFTNYHIDGLRLDAVHAIVDVSPRHILEQLATETAALARHSGRRLILIAESDSNDPRIVTAIDHGGYGIDAQWSDDFHHALHSVLTGERDGYYADFGTLAQLAKALRQPYVYDGIYSPYRQRTQGRRPRGLPRDRFVACLQNHDQIGNRARGERSSQLMSPGRLRIGATLLLTCGYIPLLFQGEEWGASTPFQYFTDHRDPALGQAVSAGRKREFAAFGWPPESIPDPQDHATFQRSKLLWNEREREPHRSLLNWYRDLIAMRSRRRELGASASDPVAVSFDETRQWLVMSRGAITVAINLGRAQQSVPLADTAHHTLLMASEAKIAPPAQGQIALPPDSVAILAAGGDSRR
jgi:maltooligosyltrehalose trehalohydrolase